jgi:O-antigen/teichoic acid export membrane protein
MMMFGACVIVGGPFLFNVVLEGRYGLGLAVLPWAVAGCVLYSVYLIAQNYLWCAEKNWLQAVPLTLGLTTNIVLNLALLPVYGLYGCVISMACGAYLCLATVLLLNRRHGMAVDRGVWLLTLAPLALGLGVLPAVAACTAVAILSVASNMLFSPAERQTLKHFALELLAKWLPRLRTIKAPGSAGGLG